MIENENQVELDNLSAESKTRKLDELIRAQKAKQAKAELERRKKDAFDDLEAEFGSQDVSKSIESMSETIILDENDDFERVLINVVRIYRGR